MAYQELHEILLEGISQCYLSTSMWYLDTGASGHMTSEKDLIIDQYELYKGRVRFGDVSNIFIEGRGKILLKSRYNSIMTLKNMVYIQSLRANILNLSRLEEECYVIHKH